MPFNNFIAIRRYLENVHNRLTNVVRVNYTIERIVKAIATIHLWFPSIEQLAGFVQFRHHN